MVALDALKGAIEELGKHPEALDRYGVEQARTFAAHRKPAAVLNALLSVLKAQRNSETNVADQEQAHGIKIRTQELPLLNPAPEQKEDHAR